MEVAEAQILLKADNKEDAIESFEDERFVIKQFFVSKLPTTKLFTSRIKKLKKYSEAYQTLLDKKEVHEDYNPITFEYNIEDVKACVNQIQIIDSEIKLKLMSAKNSQEIIFFAEQLIENYKQFAAHWRLTPILEENDIKLSNVPDPMELVVAINDFNSSGQSTFEELKQLPSTNLLKKEAIRLSLWLKFEGNE